MDLVRYLRAITRYCSPAPLGHARGIALPRLSGAAATGSLDGDPGSARRLREHAVERDELKPLPQGELEIRGIVGAQAMPLRKSADGSHIDRRGVHAQRQGA